jgi:hypothetical protein
MTSMLENLPLEMLEEIFGYLESSRDICNLTETCRNFRNIIENSEKMMRKLTLHLNYPDDLKKFGQAITNTHRRYRKLKIFRKQQPIVTLDNRPQISRSRTVPAIFQMLNQSIEILTIYWYNAVSVTRDIMNDPHRHRIRGFHHMLRGGLNIRNEIRDEESAATRAIAMVKDVMFSDFLEIMSSFGNVQELNLNNVHLDRSRKPTDPDVNFPRLTTLSAFDCDGFCFALLQNVNTLIKLQVRNSSWGSRSPGINEFETLLFAQSNLKNLTMKNLSTPRFLQRDRISEIQFKLDHLKLHNVYFADKDITTQFFESQNQLKSISFQIYNEKIRNLDEFGFFNNSLRSIINGQFPYLTSIEISKNEYKIDDCEFLNHYSNNIVKDLKYHVTSEDTKFELFKKLIRIFTNLEVVQFEADEHEEPTSNRESCFNEGTFLPFCHSLVIRNSSIRSLINLHAPNLKHFEYAGENPGEFIDNYFVGFFHRHRNIKNLIIGSQLRKSYFFVTLQQVEIITNFLEHLEHITIYNFESVNKSVKLLCEMSQLKTLTISTDQYQQFTAKTKVECSRKNLKLIHVNVGPPRPLERLCNLLDF